MGPRHPARAVADGRLALADVGRSLPSKPERLCEVKGDGLEAAYVLALALGLRRGELLGIS
jgi:hypothetical protein